SSDDITVDGAVYSFLKAEDGTALSNADEQHEEIMKTLRLWNADYALFNAASLLSDKSRTTDNANLWYTTVRGADSDYLKSHDGVLRIYNDPGSYYNYKTIAIRRGAFENCDDLQAVEFWQTNGRSENSYSDMRLVIENGAFKNCRNLKEIRLFYKVEDGTDRWQVLGPKDVIPGNDIFGFDSMTEEEFKESDVKVQFIVSPERYTDFLADPNWALYVPFIEAADYMPTMKADIVRNGLTYKYSASGSGLFSTDQVVTQNVSWWSAPLIATEVALTILTLGQSSSAASAAASAAESVTELAMVEGSKRTAQSALAFFRYGMENALKDVCKLLGGESLYATKEFLKMYKYTGIFDRVTGAIVSAEALETVAEAHIRQFLTTYIGFMTQEGAKALAKAQTMELLASNIRYQIVKELVSTQLMGGAFCSYMALRGNSDVSNFGDGMKANIIANMHQVGMTGLIITTPSKDLIYHTYVSSVDDDVTDAKIYTSPDDEERTVAISQKAFQNKKNLQTVTFHENDDVNSHEMTAMCMAIADSAFMGCTGLRSLDLRLYTEKNGTRALGPEHFILCGNDIFAGLDSTQFRIIVAEERLQDFIEDTKWGQFKRFFTTGKIEEKVQYTEFGVKYAFAYDGGTQKVEKKSGHKIEHLIAVGPDDDYVDDNNGALGFFNDIGTWNNYKLDYARQGAFRNKPNIKSVSFWDLAGWLWAGDSYTDLQMTLQDSCFAECPNLEYVDMLYLRTDGSNIAEPLTPAMLQLGKGVFDQSPKLRFKMTDRQTEWFAADSVWAKYQDRFLPCLFLPADPVVVSKLSDLKY
ncbi:MAG: leucine-rich repeat protein, partial [Prevotella sp.]